MPPWSRTLCALLRSEGTLLSVMDASFSAALALFLMMGWTQEMIGDRLNLAHNTINDRLQSEIVDLLKAIESKLKLKNPADLTRA